MALWNKSFKQRQDKIYLNQFHGVNYRDFCRKSWSKFSYGSRKSFSPRASSSWSWWLSWWSWSWWGCHRQLGGSCQRCRWRWIRRRAKPRRWPVRRKWRGKPGKFQIQIRTSVQIFTRWEVVNFCDENSRKNFFQNSLKMHNFDFTFHFARFWNLQKRSVSFWVFRWKTC